MFVFCDAIELRLKVSRLCTPPFWDRKNEMFSNAWVITPTEMSAKSRYSAPLSALTAKVALNSVVSSALPVELLAELKAAESLVFVCMVRAD